ncbi:MAG: undecaprenyldiphospho-muramoylpentapeptide beta-N-acetylglucosaminyltransferase [Candidatus Omnitrophica bacterium]|nr:undecaprenyldiphospho-muramoylpentapeptide beta-N-acetylglucosaminyltransferase [Candidatus Omnitrophota bacterium]
MRFLITAAGSGGHIYPALSLLNELKRLDKSAQTVFLSSKKNIDKKVFKNTQDRVVGFDFIPPQRKTGVNTIKFCLKNLYFLLNFSKESIRVFFLILEIKPDLVIGFGGIGSVAAIISAKLLNIPSLIHEQNVVPGLANRLLGRFTSKVATGFRKSNRYFKNRDVVFTGNPIRYDLQRLDSAQARGTLGLNIEKFTILVMGGSQGAVFINDCFIKALNGLTNEKRGILQVIHCCGNRDFTALKKKYEDIKIQARVFAFCTVMSSAYSAADLIIGRSGAGTLNEICFFGKASILIPYPYAQAHQNANAEFMREAQASNLVKQDSLTVNHLTSLIDVSIGQPQLLRSMAQKSRQLFCEESALKLAEAAMGIIRN